VGEILERRLRARSEDADAVIGRRLRGAAEEIRNYRLYDYIIVNEAVDRSVDTLAAVVKAERARRDRMEAKIRPILESFDVAETDRSTPVRFSTVQPTQALGMFNSEFLNRQAEIFAERLRREAGDDVRKQIRRALYLVTSRPPTSVEVKRGVRRRQALH